MDVTTPEEIHRNRARLVGILASLVALPILLFAFWIGGIFLSLMAGGTLGGYGAAAETPTAWWWPVAMIAMALTFVGIEVVIGVLVYRWWTRRAQRIAGDD
jgi:hypothetical protein